jgi:hypothetical protein
VLYNGLNDVFNPYTLAYNVAHEALHTFIFKGIFYVDGKEVYNDYIKGDREDYVSASGHFNDEVNLNMSGTILSTRRPTKSMKTIQPAEKIILKHWQLLQSFFYAWLPVNGYKKLKSKDLSYKNLQRGVPISD